MNAPNSTRTGSAQAEPFPTGSAAPATRRWVIDPDHSQLEFGVRHMMISTVKGHFRGIRGTIDLNESDLTASSVEVTVDAATIDTRHDDRDAHLRSEEFLDADRFPDIRFRGREVTTSEAGLQVRGDLTIRDVTREVLLEATELGRGTDPWGNARIAFRASTTVSRGDFGLTWNQTLETGGVLVGDEVAITLEIQAVAEEDADTEEEDPDVAG
jgi:polyisoprenoid-binding protein YceI